MVELRNSKPYDNPFYIRDNEGGYNDCILGKPTDAHANVLSNCVGYAAGRLNEAVFQETGIIWAHKYLNNNAENWIERVKDFGMDDIEIYDHPVKYGVGVFAKGKQGVSSDGAGHVMFFEEVYNSNEVYTSESAYGGTAFYNVKRNNNNNRWGMGSDYTWLGCIVSKHLLKYVNPSPTPEPTPEIKDLKFKEGDKVVINGDLYKTSATNVSSGKVTNKITFITRTYKGARNPYNTTGDLGWMEESDIKLYEEPVSETLKKGDKVKILATGNGNSLGTSDTAGGIGWEREILDIFSGKAFPYQVGNSRGTTGFYKESALKKI